jgi:hypothetical protein
MYTIFYFIGGGAHDTLVKGIRTHGSGSSKNSSGSINGNGLNIGIL